MITRQITTKASNVYSKRVKNYIDYISVFLLQVLSIKYSITSTFVELNLLSNSLNYLLQTVLEEPVSDEKIRDIFLVFDTNADGYFDSTGK